MSEEEISEYLSKPYSRVLVREPDGGFSAHVLEWTGCYGEGDTADEAMMSLEASMATWVSVMLEDGNPIPEPTAREYSGKLLLRLPKETHRSVALRAAAEGVSSNQLVLSFVEAGLARGSWPTASIATAPVWSVPEMPMLSSSGWVVVPGATRDVASFTIINNVYESGANVGKVRLLDFDFPLWESAVRDAAEVPAGQGARRG
jgi:predicted RNase H-like HicB family nuclease